MNILTFDKVTKKKRPLEKVAFSHKIMKICLDHL